jgi:hypothetical protein
MQWASAISIQPDAGSALSEIKRAISEQLRQGQTVQFNNC